jgi:hypothetical protein
MTRKCRPRAHHALIPRLSEDLARQIRGCPPDEDLAAVVKRLPYSRPFPAITVAKWHALIDALAHGVPFRRAVRESLISAGVLRLYLAANAELRSQVRETRRHRKLWRGYSPLIVEEVLADLVMSEMSLRQALAKHGVVGRSAYERFLRLTQRVPEVAVQYLRAKSGQRTYLGDQFFEEIGETQTRDDRRQLNKRIHRAMQVLTPRRLLPKRELDPITAARRRVRRHRHAK